MTDDLLTCPRCAGQMEYIEPDASFGPNADEMLEHYCCNVCGLWLTYEPEETTIDTYEHGDDFAHWGLG